MDIKRVIEKMIRELFPEITRPLEERLERLERKYGIDNEFISRSDAARIIGATPKTIYNWEKQGLIKSYRRASGRKMYKRSEIEPLEGKKYLMKVKRA